MSVKGSLKMLISGVRKVKITNAAAIAHRMPKASFGCLQLFISLLNVIVSHMYEAAAEMKKIAMLIQSGELPIMPLHIDYFLSK